MLPRDHERWMKAALRLAAKGRHAVSPNPMVGACVVRNGRLVASGYHRKFVGPHAERIALEKAGRRAKGATLYVTLEPCSAWMKTPPCAPLIVERGIREVVIGSLDPNPLNCRKGVNYLEKHGVKIVTGILAGEAAKLNEGFYALMKNGRPFVTLKMAETLDGKIATREGRSRWISSPSSREYVHRLRTCHDAVLVGKHTFYQDNPRITVPANAKCLRSGKPWKIVVVSDEKIPKHPRLFEDSRLCVFVCPRAKIKKISCAMNKTGNSRVLLPVSEKNGRLDIREALKKLGGLGIATLLVEGGGEMAWSLIESGCVDRAIWIVAPQIFGGRDAKTSVEGAGVSDPSRAYSFRTEKVSRSGEDWIFEGTIKKK